LQCSALIKLLEDGSVSSTSNPTAACDVCVDTDCLSSQDIFISQETWTSFDSMLRIYKMYDFPYTMTGDPASGRVPAERVSFSSYPAGALRHSDLLSPHTFPDTEEASLGLTEAAVDAQC